MRLRSLLGIALAGAVVLLVLGATVRAPLVVLQPGPTYNVLGVKDGGSEIVSVAGRRTYPVDGRLLMTTVGVSGNLTLAQAVREWATGGQVVPRSTVYDPELSPEQVERTNRQQFEESERVATEAAARELNFTGPSGVTIELAGVGGPSAGLVFSVAVVDRLTPGALLAGRTVAGTGTIDSDGRVGRVGGITHKIEAARAVGAELFLVPAAECDEARGQAAPGLALTPVSSLSDAIHAVDAFAKRTPLTRC